MAEQDVSARSAYISNALTRLFSQVDTESIEFSECKVVDQLDANDPDDDIKSCAKVEFVSYYRNDEGRTVSVESRCQRGGPVLKPEMRPTSPLCINSCPRNYSIVVKIGVKTQVVPKPGPKVLRSGVVCFREEVNSLVADVRFEQRFGDRAVRHHRNVVIDRYQLSSGNLVAY